MRLVIFIILMCCFSVNTLAADLIISSHPDYPPYFKNNNGKMNGMVPNIVAKIFEKANISHKFEYAGPWKRVQKKLEKGEIDMIAGIYYTEERAKKYQYTVSFMDDPVSIFVSVDSNQVFSQ